MIVCPLHFKVDPERLAAVKAEMQERGAPVLKGHFDNVTCSIFLKEGTHRINAAFQLGVVPTIITVTWWRTEQALVNAREAIYTRGLSFIAVNVYPEKRTA